LAVNRITQSKRKAKDFARVVTQPHRERKRKNRAAREGLVSELLMSVVAVCPLVERADSNKVRLALTLLAVRLP
jgi:hypothetical protein